jgi:hypothetical protein
MSHQYGTPSPSQWAAGQPQTPSRILTRAQSLDSFHTPQTRPRPGPSTAANLSSGPPIPAPPQFVSLAPGAVQNSWLSNSSSQTGGSSQAPPPASSQSSQPYNGSGAFAAQAYIALILPPLSYPPAVAGPSGNQEQTEPPGTGGSSREPPQVPSRSSQRADESGRTLNGDASADEPRRAGGSSQSSDGVSPQPSQQENGSGRSSAQDAQPRKSSTSSNPPEGPIASGNQNHGQHQNQERGRLKRKISFRNPWSKSKPERPNPASPAAAIQPADDPSQELPQAPRRSSKKRPWSSFSRKNCLPDMTQTLPVHLASGSETAGPSKAATASGGSQTLSTATAPNSGRPMSPATALSSHPPALTLGSSRQASASMVDLGALASSQSSRSRPNATVTTIAGSSQSSQSLLPPAILAILTSDIATGSNTAPTPNTPPNSNTVTDWTPPRVASSSARSPSAARRPAEPTQTSRRFQTWSANRKSWQPTQLEAMVPDVQARAQSLTSRSLHTLAEASLSTNLAEADGSEVVPGNGMRPVSDYSLMCGATCNVLARLPRVCHYIVEQY